VKPPELVDVATPSDVHSTVPPGPPGIDHPAPGDGANDGDRGFSIARAAGIVVVVAILAFWIYAFTPLSPKAKADGLKDKAMVARIDDTCGAAKTQVAKVPFAFQSSTAADRANQVDAVTDILAGMVVQIRTESIANANDARLLGLWLADWDDYLNDRRAYAEGLRVDERTPFTVTQRFGAQITTGMDNFVTVMNKLGNCKTPSDV
jgi:hypothetical protein